MPIGDEGQATPLVAMIVFVAGLVALGLARLGGDAVDQARASTAADAAALAGAAEGRTGANQLAVRNGAELVSFRQLGSDVIVVVRLGDASARARARVTGQGPAG